MPHIKSGDAKCLVIMGKAKPGLFPNAAAVSELGALENEAALWRMVLAPKGLPAGKAAKLEAAIRQAMATPVMLTFFAEQGERPIAQDGHKRSPASRPSTPRSPKPPKAWIEAGVIACEFIPCALRHEARGADTGSQRAPALVAIPDAPGILGMTVRSALAATPHTETVAYFATPDYCGRAEPPGALGHAVAASKLLP